MKKRIIINLLLSSFCLSGCFGSIFKGNSDKESSETYIEESEEDESMADVYMGYPDNPEGYNVPRHCQYSVMLESNNNSNGSHTVHTSHVYDVIIDGDEFYAVENPEDEEDHALFYCKGRWVDSSDPEQYWIHSWFYDIYMYSKGYGWRHLITGGVSYALNYFHSKEFFDLSNYYEKYGGRKTGESKLIDGETCDEYDLTYWGGHYYYYSETAKIFKGFMWGDEESYLYYYISNYKTEDVRIPEGGKPGADILVA